MEGKTPREFEGGWDEVIAYYSSKVELAAQLTEPLAREDEDTKDGAEDSCECSTADCLFQALDAIEKREDDLTESMHAYVGAHACADSEAAKQPRAPGVKADETKLNDLIVEAGLELTQHLALFQKKMERIRGMFLQASHNAGLKSTAVAEGMSADKSVDGMISQLANAAALVQDTRCQGERFLKNVTCEHTTVAAEPSATEFRSDTSVVEFVVKRIDKLVGRDVKRTATLHIDRSRGVVWQNSEDPKTGEPIVQLIKSRSDKSKLGIVLKNKGRKNYAFDSGAKREEFAQLIQTMNVKNGLHDSGLTSKVTIFIGTFNMGEVAPPADLSSWFRCAGDGRVLRCAKSEVLQDIIAIGTQEQTTSEKDFIAAVRAHVGCEYGVVAKSTLLQMRLVVLIKEALRPKISHVQTSSVACGIGGIYGNKGGVAVSMYCGGTSLCFINAHLAAGATKFGRRNADFRDIVAKLSNGDKKLASFDVTNQFHHCFWFGDLNYRINLPVEAVLQYVKDRNLNELQLHDQLRRIRHVGEAFWGFEEGKIEFQPTYRYDRGTRETYAYEKNKGGGKIKINAPSYTDRVMWKSFPNQSVTQTSYGCTKDIMTSDHSPVFATFDLQIANQFVSQSKGAQTCKVVIETATASILTGKLDCKSSFFLEFYGNFFEGRAKSEASTATGVKDIGTPALGRQDVVCPTWRDVATVRPILPDRVYLETEQLLVVVKSADQNEAHGEGCITLCSLFGDGSTSFTCELTHRGIYKGRLTGRAYILGATGASGHSDELYRTLDDFEDVPKQAPVGAAQPLAGELLSATAVPPPRSRVATEELEALRRLKNASFQPAPGSPPPKRPAHSLAVTLATQAQEELKAWLQSMGLPHVAPVLISNGWDGLEDVLDIESVDLDNMGIANPDKGVLVQAIQERQKLSAVGGTCSRATVCLAQRGAPGWGCCSLLLYSLHICAGLCLRVSLCAQYAGALCGLGLG